MATDDPDIDRSTWSDSDGMTGGDGGTSGLEDDSGASIPLLDPMSDVDSGLDTTQTDDVASLGSDAIALAHT